MRVRLQGLAGERRVDAPARPERQEHAPEEQAHDQRIAAEEHQDIAVEERAVQHEGDEGGEPRAPSEEERQGGEPLDAEQQGRGPELAVEGVQRHAPKPVDAHHPVARHHAEVGVERAQIHRAQRQVGKQHGAERRAEQGETAQVEAEGAFEENPAELFQVRGALRHGSAGPSDRDVSRARR
jgi:hypothetical protein